MKHLAYSSEQLIYINGLREESHCVDIGEIRLIACVAGQDNAGNEFARCFPDSLNDLDASLVTQQMEIADNKIRWRIETHETAPESTQGCGGAGFEAFDIEQHTCRVDNIGFIVHYQYVATEGAPDILLFTLRPGVNGAFGFWQVNIER
jgi:hypothetical protein